MQVGKQVMHMYMNVIMSQTTPFFFLDSKIKMLLSFALFKSREKHMYIANTEWSWIYYEATKRRGVYVDCEVTLSPLLPLASILSSTLYKKYTNQYSTAIAF